MESIHDEVGRTLEVCEGKAGGMAPFLDLPVKDSDLNEKVLVLALCAASDFGYLLVAELTAIFGTAGSNVVVVDSASRTKTIFNRQTCRGRSYS
jgi:Na+-transporting methylmalonyl-CoA/oxaloacetate decarboxylase beta subunit